MSISSVGSNQAQTVGSLLLQQLMASESGAQDTSGSSTLGDLLTLSPVAQQLTQAPDAVIQAMGDLFSGQKQVQSDLTQLKAYFQQNPQSLASLLSVLQGGVGTYSAASSTDSTSAILTALANGQANNSDPSALLSLLSGRQNSLFDFLGNSSDGSDSSALSLLG